MVKIGVTGLFCAGKDTFANYLIEKKGFEHISLSDIIREEADIRGIESTRDNLFTLGNELREKQGPNVLAKIAVQRMNPTKNYVITSIRNPLEVKYLASSKNFVLVNIESPLEVRFRRLIARGRGEKDANTLEEFKANEERELTSSNNNAQKILDCIEMSRLTLQNHRGIEEFYKNIEESFQKIEEMASFTRPEWDEYFMELARAVGRRGTCERGRAGCLIVKDKRIMTTGYAGAPPGLAHCDEVGHWFKRTIHEDGNITQHCIRTVHAEANAIAQAAKHGINIDKTTLYCKMEPCLDCTKLLISSGIKRIVCEKKYHASKESREMLEETGVRVEVLNDELEKYDGQK